MYVNSINVFYGMIYLNKHLQYLDFPTDFSLGTTQLECSSCFNDLDDGMYIRALGQDWHADCFRCSVCDLQLSSWYIEKDGLLFCRNDYYTKFGESCQQCGEVGLHNFSLISPGI